MPKATTGEKQKFIRLVEGARGLAAFEVFIYHIIEIYEVAPLGTIQSYLLVPFSFGHEAVILFFLLSGFSIHYSNFPRDLGTWQGIRKYLTLRFVRIYPILAFAILVTLVLITLGATLDVPPYNRLFSRETFNSAGLTLLALTDRRSTEGAWFFVPYTNPPLWSLSYEILYYLAYPLFWLMSKRFGIRPAVLCGLIISVLAAAKSQIVGPDHLTNVFQLFGIWCIGAWLGEKRFLHYSFVLKTELLLILPCACFAVRMELRDTLIGFGNDWLLAVGLATLMLSYLAVPQEISRKRSLLAWLALIFLIILVYQFVVWQGHYSGSTRLLQVKVGGLIISSGLVMFWVPMHRWRMMLGKGILLFFPIGAFSYGLYVIHYPVMVASNRMIAPWTAAMPALVIGMLTRIIHQAG